MTESTESDELLEHQLIQGQQMAHAIFIRALLATHPNPNLLRACVQAYSKNFEEFISEDGWGPLPTEIFRNTVASFQDHIGLAAEDGAA